MAALYITDGSRVARVTDGTFAHLAPRELEADMRMARSLGGTIRPQRVTAEDWAAHAASRIDIRALNRAAAEATRR